MPLTVRRQKPMPAFQVLLGRGTGSAPRPYRLARRDPRRGAAGQLDRRAQPVSVWNRTKLEEEKAVLREAFASLSSELNTDMSAKSINDVVERMRMKSVPAGNRSPLAAPNFPTRVLKTKRYCG